MPARRGFPANGAVYPNVSAGNSLRQAAQIIKAGVGTRCIFVNVNGTFDTHANQLLANTNDYRPLGAALAAFATDLGGAPRRRRPARHHGVRPHRPRERLRGHRPRHGATP